MKKFAAAILVFMLLGGLSLWAGDKSASSTVPRYIVLETDQLKPGQDQTYNKLVTHFKAAAATSCPDCYWLTFSPITGIAGQVTYVSFEDSWAGIAQEGAGVQRIRNEMLARNPNIPGERAQALAGTRRAIAEFSPAMSLNPEKIEAAQAAIWRVTTFQIKPAQNTPFAELAKEIIELHKKANDDAQWLAYNIIAGAPGPRVMFLRPVKNPAELDQPDAPEFMALMTPAMRKHFNEVMAQTEVANETNFYVAIPALSRPPQDYLAANPKLWIVTEPDAAAAQSGKKANKAAQPAAIKAIEKEKK